MVLQPGYAKKINKLFPSLAWPRPWRIHCVCCVKLVVIGLAGWTTSPGRSMCQRLSLDLSKILRTFFAATVNWSKPRVNCRVLEGQRGRCYLRARCSAREGCGCCRWSLDACSSLVHAQSLASSCSVAQFPLLGGIRAKPVNTLGTRLLMVPLVFSVCTCLILGLRVRASCILHGLTGA